MRAPLRAMRDACSARHRKSGGSGVDGQVCYDQHREHKKMIRDLQTDKLIRHTRNPFGVMDVPEPAGPDVIAFAATASLEGRDDDANTAAWAALSSGAEPGAIEGRWSSRWNGG